MNFIPPVVDVASEARNFNNPIYGTRGEFSLSSTVSVPYFIALLDIETLQSELKTHEQVAPSLENTYSLVELYQRQIDEERVEKEIVNGYLNIPDKLKFFNALTVALLPKDESGTIQRNFEGYPNNDPEVPISRSDQYDAFFNNDSFDRSVFGGVQFITSTTHNLARLRWDKKRVDAVAVDGQHRLRALQIWYQKRQGALNEQERKTRIPVIFLLLHESAGFRFPAAAAQIGIKSIAREIFTDLNKNAKEVDLATQIILDDRSIEACCVRGMITESTCEDHETLLPLSLLRWQDANYKFDSSYYLNSLVNLYLVVKDLLNIEPPKDPTDKSEVLKFIKQFELTLGSGSPRRIVVDNVSLEEYYGVNYCEQSDTQTQGDPHTPFSSIPPHYLPQAQLGFHTHFSPWLLRLLRELKPYTNLLSYARNERLISGEFGQYYAQPKSHRETLRNLFVEKYGENWKQEVLIKHEQAIYALKADPALGDSWAFKTLFQKAYIELGKHVFIGLSGAADKYGTVDEFLKFFNALYDSEILYVQSLLPGSSHYLWTSISVNYGNRKIKVTNTSRKRMLGLLRLWYFGWRYLVSTDKVLLDGRDSDEGVSAKTLLKLFSQKQNSLDWPEVRDDIKNLQSGFVQDATALESNENLDDAGKERAAEDRLLKVFAYGLKSACKLLQNQA